MLSALKEKWRYLYTVCSLQVSLSLLVMKSGMQDNGSASAIAESKQEAL